MPNNTYLRIHRGRYIWRRRIPNHISMMINKAEFVRSLGSIPYSQAVVKARSLTAACDQLFEEIMTKELTPDLAEELAQDWFADILNKGEATFNKAAPMTSEQVESKISSNAALVDKYRNAIKGRQTQLIEKTATNILSKYNIYEANNHNSQTFRLNLLRAFVAVAEALEQKQAGNHGHVVTDPLFKDIDLKVFSKSRKFSEVSNEFQIEKAQSVGESSLESYRTASKLFIECCGDKRIVAYKASDFENFIQTIRTIPTPYWRSPEEREKTILKVIEEAKVKGNYKRIADTSITKHHDVIVAIFKHAILKGDTSTNITNGVYQRPKKKQAANKDKEDFTSEHLRIFFQLPQYSGFKYNKGLRRRAERGNVICRDHKWWIPLLGLYQGCRIEEICQLRVDDIQTYEGLNYIRIYETDKDGNPVDENGNVIPPRRLKNPQSTRNLPLHKTIIELGFMDYVKVRKKQKNVMLFPDLRPGGKRQRYSASYSSDFKDQYLSKIGLSDPKYSFHSFRHTFLTGLARAFPDITVLKKAAGHKLDGEIDRYFKGFTIKQLHEMFDKVEFKGITCEKILPDASVRIVEHEDKSTAKP